LEGRVDIAFDEIQPGRGADGCLSAATHDDGITPAQLGMCDGAVVSLNCDGFEAETLDKEAQRVPAVPER
jgi:hypothetical protein